MLGSGNSRAYKYADSRIRISLGQFACGILIGDISVIFDQAATYSIETETYSIMGVVSPEDVQDILIKYPQLRKDIMEEILWNPYDYQREEFVTACRKHIQYLLNAEEEVLLKLYY